MYDLCQPEWYANQPAYMSQAYRPGCRCVYWNPGGDSPGQLLLPSATGPTGIWYDAAPLLFSSGRWNWLRCLRVHVPQQTAVEGSLWVEDSTGNYDGRRLQITKALEHLQRGLWGLRYSAYAIPVLRGEPNRTADPWSTVDMLEEWQVPLSPCQPLAPGWKVADVRGTIIKLDSYTNVWIV